MKKLSCPPKLNSQYHSSNDRKYSNKLMDSPVDITAGFLERTVL